MKKFSSIHDANKALPDLGRGECIAVGTSTYRVANRFGSKVLKPQAHGTGVAGVRFIPGEPKFKKNSRGIGTGDK